MKGLLLAGGHGTRLRPLTFSGNKHMLPIANQPMLFYGLRHLVDAGIRDVAVVLGPIHEGVEEAIGSGTRLGANVTFIRQGEPRGLAHAVLCAREFLSHDPFVMYLGDNLLQQGVKPFIRSYRAHNPDAVIGVARVTDPTRFGVVELDGDRIISLVEKPQHPRSSLALVGVYLFTEAIHDVIDSLQPSARGELEITDAIAALNSSGKRVVVNRLRGWWKDTGRPEDLLEANDLILETTPRSHYSLHGIVSAGADISGRVRLEPGSMIGPGARIHGPVIIGRRTMIEGTAYIGPNTAVGDDCVIRDSTVRRAIVMDQARLEGPIELTDSIVGRNARLRADGTRSLPISCVVGDSTQIRL